MKLISVEATLSSGQTDRAITEFEQNADRVRAMTGCQRYAIFRAPAQEDQVVILQKWASMDDFNAYRASAEFAEMGARLKPLMAAAPVTTIAQADG